MAKQCVVVRRLLLCLLALIPPLIACHEVPPDVVEVPYNAAWASRGEHLVKGLAACGHCHGEKRDPRAVLSGGLASADRYGEVYAPNLTPHSDGLGGWTAGQFVSVMRGGLAPGERELSSKVHRGYEWMTDDDLRGVYAYLRSLPPVPGTVERREIDFFTRNTVGFLDVQREVKGYVPAISAMYPVANGEYLTTHVARCGACHDSPGSFFSGGGILQGGQVIKNEYGEKIAPAIDASSVTGLGSWSQDALINYLRTGQTADGRYVDPHFCPVPFYRLASDEELQNIARFLKGVKEN